MTMEASKRRFKTEREVERRKDEQERRSLREERLYLEHERKSFQRLVLEQSELAAAERARAAIRQKKPEDPPRANVEPGMLKRQKIKRKCILESCTIIISVNMLCIFCSCRGPRIAAAASKR